MRNLTNSYSILVEQLLLDPALTYTSQETRSRAADLFETLLQQTPTTGSTRDRDLRQALTDLVQQLRN